MERGTGAEALPPQTVELRTDDEPSQDSPAPATPSPAKTSALSAPGCTTTPSTAGALTATPATATVSATCAAPVSSAAAITSPTAPTVHRHDETSKAITAGINDPLNDPTEACIDPKPNPPSRPTFRKAPAGLPKEKEASPMAGAGTRPPGIRKLFAEDSYPHPSLPLGCGGQVQMPLTTPLTITVPRPHGQKQREETDVGKATSLYKTAYVKASFLGCDVAGYSSFMRCMRAFYG